MPTSTSQGQIARRALALHLNKRLQAGLKLASIGARSVKVDPSMLPDIYRLSNDAST